jgi:hypothetical protein
MFKIIFLISIAFVVDTALIAQTINLINNTVSDKNSKTVYIGIDNNFKIEGETFEGIIPQDDFSLKANELIVRPNKIGKLTVLFLTKESKIPMTFEVRTLPEVMVLVAGQSNKFNKDLTPDDSQLTLKTVNNDDFFNNYDITSFAATLDGKTFEVSGNNFSNELLSAIRNAKGEDMLTINSLIAFNKDINKTININGSYSFKMQ